MFTRKLENNLKARINEKMREDNKFINDKNEKYILKNYK